MSLPRQHLRMAEFGLRPNGTLKNWSLLCFQEYKTVPKLSDMLRSNANKQLLCFNANLLDNNALGVGGACKLDQITLETGNSTGRINKSTSQVKHTTLFTQTDSLLEQFCLRKDCTCTWYPGLPSCSPSRKTSQMTCCKNGRNPGKPLSMPNVKSLKMSRYLMPKCAKSIQKLLVGPQSFLPVDPQLTGTSDSARLSHGEKKRRAKLSLCCYRLSRQTQRYLTILYSVIGTEMCC